jgi:hypothetical protein
MNKLVFDTETTGLPKTISFNNYYPPEKIEYYNSSRIVQIAYIILDQDNIEVKKFSVIIKPDNFLIENAHIHNISQEEAEKEGMSFKDMISIFYEDLKTCDTLVAHNLNFDRNILLSECYRYGLTQVAENILLKKQYCTMIEGKKRVLEYNYKYPRLVELYQHLYNQDWVQLHDALDDAIKCKQCYLKLLETEK